jgi:hypothetical protein
MLIVILIGKLIIYSIWCYIGMRLFQSPRLLAAANVSILDADIAGHTASYSGIGSAAKALRLGFFRLALGSVFGTVAIFAAWIFLSSGDAYDRGVLAYALFLVPVRALEWWLTAGMIGKTSASSHVLLWVFGGVVLSCLADIPINFAVVDSFSGFC